MGHAVELFFEDIFEHLWNSVLTVNSVLCGGACLFTIYAAGASVYYLTPRPIELGVILVLILVCTEILFAALEEILD